MDGLGDPVLEGRRPDALEGGEVRVGGQSRESPNKVQGGVGLAQDLVSCIQ
eukprot:SAG11_NODE_25716_length_355_cov_0.605469_1_plen_51_part_00